MVIQAGCLRIKRLGRTVLEDVSFSIQDGECVSIIGPNGAGKSTLMAGLLGLLPIDDGTVWFDSRDVTRLRRRDIARKIAYVPQLHEGYMGFDVRDVIESGRYAHLDPLTPLSDEDRNVIAEAAETCGVTELLDRRVDTLSGGERQKVWIAAALAQQAPMLFLDEPTNALDPAHQADLVRIMRDVAGRGGALVVICHDLNLPLMLGGRVIALREGRLIFDGTSDELLDTTRLEELFGTPFELHRNSAEQVASIHLKM